MSRFSTWLVSWVFVFGLPLDVVFSLVAVVVTEPLSTRHAHRLILLLVSVDRKGHNGNGVAEEDAAKSEEHENEDGGVIEIDENNSSVVGERRSNASVKSEV